MSGIDHSREMVARQLGRDPVIEFEIVVRCTFGCPAVIRNDPFSSAGKPNPNLYYLTCPYLRKALSRLEDAGMIARLEAGSAATSLAAALKQAHEEHQREWSRAAATSLSEKAASAQPPNIAAASDETRIKCLHAHFAWYLTHPDYQLGKILARELDAAWCDDKRCLREWG